MTATFSSKKYQAFSAPYFGDSTSVEPLMAARADADPLQPVVHYATHNLVFDRVLACRMRISSILFIFAGVIDVLYLWMWVHSIGTHGFYLTHIEIKLVEMLPVMSVTATFGAMFMYWYTVRSWFIPCADQAVAGTFTQLPRSLWQVILLFMPVICCLGLPLLWTELIILLRKNPRSTDVFSHTEYIAAIKKIFWWTLSWLVVWGFFILHIISTFSVTKDQLKVSNEEVWAIYLLFMGLHVWYTYFLLKYISSLERKIIDPHFIPGELATMR